MALIVSFDFRELSLAGQIKERKDKHAMSPCELSL